MATGLDAVSAASVVVTDSGGFQEEAAWLGGASTDVASTDVAHRAAEQAVHVGDNPNKDVAGALAVGMDAVRVRTGEYAALEGPTPWLDVADAAEAMDARPTALGTRPPRLDRTPTV